MEQIVEQLLRSPKFEIYREQMNAVSVREQQARQEFIDRINEDDHAEFINGEVVIHSPVKSEYDACVKRLTRLVSIYVESHQLGRLGGEQMMISLTRNDYEPDAKFWPLSIAKSFQPDQMRFPAPTWITEVLSPSTEKNDRGVKFEDYAAHGIAEYWIVDPIRQIIEQYELAPHREYELTLKSQAGPIRSSAISGLSFPIEAIFDDAVNLAALRELLK